MKHKKEFEKMREKQADFLEDVDEIPKYYAKDIMIKPVFLKKEDKTDLILKKLKKESINECIVIDKDGKFYGEINTEDIIRLFLSQIESEPLVKILNVGYRREFLYLKAKDLINKQKTTVKPNEPINKVIKLLFKEKSSYLPVVDKENRVLGVITPSSTINFLKDK